MKKVITVTLNPCIDKTFNLEKFSKGNVNRADDWRIDAGGKGINVSRALTNFKVSNISLGIIGGSTGERLKRLLLEEGIESDFLEVLGDTRTNYKIFDKETKDTTDINEAGIPMDNMMMERFLEKYRQSIKDAEYVVLAGSLPPNTNKAVYRVLIEEAEKMGVRAILDAEGDALREGIAAIPYAIKPNIHEFEELLGRKMKNENEILEGMKELNKSGIELVVVSMGGDGAIFMKDNIAFKTKPLLLDKKSTVGCGDAVVSGIVYSLVNGFDLKKTAMIASAAGSITASKDGTNMCTKDEVMSVYGNVLTERIEFL